MSQTELFADVIVLGLGAMGSATLYQLAKRGVSALGIDQFAPPHNWGSSHGNTRLTRQAIGEGEAYTPFALRSYDIWDEIERESGQELLTRTGGLILGDTVRPSSAHGIADFMGNTLSCAQKYGIGHERLTATDIGIRYPQFKLGGNEMGYFEFNAGYLRPERCIRTQLELATRNGATIRTGEKVLGFIQETTGVLVSTNRRQYRAKKLVISAGPWVSELLGENYEGLFKVYRQVLYWFDVEDSYQSFVQKKFPVFIWNFDAEEGGGIYGFPALDGPAGGIKIAHEQYSATTDPEHVDRTVTQKETNTMYDQFVAPRLVGVGRECLKAVSCLYTVTPDSGFVLDTHPLYKDVTVASPCSGHGFKHSAAIGEALAEMATEKKTTLDLSAFPLTRFPS